MKLTGEYFLLGAESSGTREARDAIERLGFEKPTSGIGAAAGPGEVIDAVTVAYFTIQSVSGGDIVGAALQVLDLLKQWAHTDGRPKDVRRCDITFKNNQNGEEVSITGFEHRTNEELIDLVEALKS